jgi:hypothetical protein
MLNFAIADEALEYQMRIAGQPNIVGLSMAGGEARFKDTALICTPGAPN